MLAAAGNVAVWAEAGGGGAPGGSADGGAPSVASRYVIRMQERVKQADDAANRAAQLLSDGDYEGAIKEFRAALDLLPDAPMTEDRREAYTKRFADASVRLAEQRAEQARYDDAITLLEAVLAPDVDPDNVEAKRLLEKLQDPEYYSPAVTPEHLDRVRQVERALEVARGYYNIGDFDGAIDEYHKVLNLDPYNKAARGAMEDVRHEQINYYDVAYNETRAHMMMEIARSWEMPVPQSLEIEAPPEGVVSESDSVRIIEDKLRKIQIPSIEFVNTPLSSALEFLSMRAYELDPDPDPATKGVNIILNAGGSGGGGGAPSGGGGTSSSSFDDPAGAAQASSSFGGAGVENTPINLKVSQVPLGEALRYTTNLANLKYKVEPHAVVVVPLSEPTSDLFSKVFSVPPTFLSSGGGGSSSDAAPADPFADPVESTGSGISQRRSAKEVLSDAGVTFPPGASAIYNKGNSQLIATNTQANLDLIQIYVESIRGEAEKQIYISSRFVEIAQEDGKELGFDWLLGPFDIPTSGEKVFGSGGTLGNQRTDLSPSDFSFTQPGTTVPVGGNPVTSGLRSGSLGVSADSIDGLIAEAAGAAQSASSLAPAIFGVAGVFTDPQFQVVIRALNQQKGTDLLSAPSVMARSGQRAKVEVIREFIYPTEYDPPEIPNEVGTGFGAGVSTFPVTPANPTAFETRNTGVTLEVDPVIGADGFTIDLNLSPEVVEFEGFINYGSPIQTGATNNVTGAPTTIVLTENRIEMPVFNTRKVTTQVTIWDGQTVAIGGLIREDIQDIEDKVPLLGDIPVAGRLFRSSTELHLKRNLTVFVKADIQDPSGQKINP